jgi:hypothetical protein
VNNADKFTLIDIIAFFGSMHHEIPFAAFFEFKKIEGIGESGRTPPNLQVLRLTPGFKNEFTIKV